MVSVAKIVVAEHAGACYGVQRALDMVTEVAKNATTPVRTLGPLIHNPQVVASLEDTGVTVTEDVPTKAEAGSTLVLRTHGVRPEVEAAALERGLSVLDATCPYVKRVHHAVVRLAREGYQVLVVGEAGHPEVDAILGYAEGAIAIPNVEALCGITIQKRVGLVSQTTQAKATFDAVVNALTAQAQEVCVINTICEATSERQVSAAELAKACDVMVVIGGRNSANTCRLTEICAAECGSVHHIETPDELDGSWFEGAAQIGVTAGASTPLSMIDTVVAAIDNYCKE